MSPATGKCRLYNGRHFVSRSGFAVAITYLVCSTRDEAARANTQSRFQNAPSLNPKINTVSSQNQYYTWFLFLGIFEGCPYFTPFFLNLKCSWGYLVLILVKTAVR